jgi:hypothetical protein
MVVKRLKKKDFRSCTGYMFKSLSESHLPSLSPGDNIPLRAEARTSENHRSSSIVSIGKDDTELSKAHDKSLLLLRFAKCCLDDKGIPTLETVIDEAAILSVSD